MKKANLLNIVIIIFLVCVLAGSLIFGGDNAQTMTAVNDVVENVISGSGIVTVYSTPIIAGEDGHALFSAKEGQLIKKYTTVASIYSGEITKETEERLKLANDKITFSKTAAQYENEVFNDIGSINKEINSQLAEITADTAYGDYSEVYNRKSRIITYHKKSLELKGETPAEIAAGTVSDISGIEQELGVTKSVYTSPADGMLSSKTDNFDELINPDTAKTLTPKKYKEIYKTDVKPKKEVVKDQPFAKIINNFEWYLVSSFAESEISDLKVGSSVNIRIKSVSDTEVSGTVEYISDPEGKECVIVVKSTKYIDGVYTSDKVEFDIVKRKYRGIKIPSSALMKRGEKEGVYAVKGGVYKFIEVEVIYRDKNFVIIKDMSTSINQGGNVILYDLVVTNPEKVKEGSISGGA